LVLRFAISQLRRVALRGEHRNEDDPQIPQPRNEDRIDGFRVADHVQESRDAAVHHGARVAQGEDIGK
jgi:hypothetical protein